MWSVKLVVWLRRLVATFSGTVPEPMRLGHFRVSLLTIKASATKTSWTLAPNLLPTCGERIAWTCHYYCMVHVVWPKQDTAWQLETTYLWDSPQSLPCPWRIPTGPSFETSARTSPRNALGPPPTLPYYKTNIDAAIFDQLVGLGVVIRNHKGAMVATLFKHL